MSKHDEVMNKI